MPQRFYITTAINYVNDIPHIGHMYDENQHQVMMPILVLAYASLKKIFSWRTLNSA